MDASNEYSTAGNGRIVNQPNKPARDSQPSPKDIGREFVRQYYTMLSERPQDVFRFYSHESYFMHGSEDPIQGQQNIQKAIENLQFVDCKARIHTVNGTSTVNSGLVIQVCGELSIRKEAGRRFLQTFILCPQTPKKYYVHNDIFQWLDQAFGRENRDRSESESPAAPGSAYAPMTDINGVNSVVNGQEEDEHLSTHNGHHPQSQPTTSDSTGLSHVPANGPTMGDDPATTEDDHAINTGAEEDDRMAPQSMDAAQETTAPEAPAEPEPVVPAGPMTWASRVARPSGPTKTAPPATTTTNAPPQRDAAAAQQQQQQRPQPPSNAPPSAAATETRQERQEPTDPACKLYLGSILRTLSPKNPQDCEAEIKKVFEQFGPVYSVRVPRKAIDDSLHDENGRLSAGFAFVVMETKEGADRAYQACTRDDKNRFMLQVSLPSFGFTGLAALSPQDTDRRGGGGGSTQRGGYGGGQGGRAGGNFGGNASQNQYVGGGSRGGRGGMQSGGYRGGSSGASNSVRGGGAPPQYNRSRPARNLQ